MGVRRVQVEQRLPLAHGRAGDWETPVVTACPGCSARAARASGALDGRIAGTCREAGGAGLGGSCPRPVDIATEVGFVCAPGVVISLQPVHRQS